MKKWIGIFFLACLVPMFLSGQSVVRNPVTVSMGNMVFVTNNADRPLFVTGMTFSVGSLTGSFSMDTNINIASASANVPVYTPTGTNLGVTLSDTNIGATLLTTNVGATLLNTNVGATLLTTNVGATLLDTNVGATILNTNFGVTILGGSVSTNINISSASANVPMFTPTGTNLNVIIAGGTNSIVAVDPFPVYTPTGTNLNVTLSDTNLGVTIVGGTISADTNINIAAFTGVTASTPLFVSNVNAISLSGDVNVTNLVYVEGSVGVTNTPTVVISQKDMGVTNNVTVVGLTTIATVTPYITNIAYVDGDVMSHYAVLDVARVAGKAVQLQSITVIDADDEGMGFEVMLFEAAPTLALPGEAWATSDADMLNCAIFVSIGSSDYTDLGGNRIANVANINKSIVPDSNTSVFVGLRARGTSTYTATNDVTLKFVFYQD